jgi:hypothetical protein
MASARESDFVVNARSSFHFKADCLVILVPFVQPGTHSNCAAAGRTDSTGHGNSGSGTDTAKRERGCGGTKFLDFSEHRKSDGLR